jgi:RNA polymerase sigma-70 factor, ECF subfamily
MSTAAFDVALHPTPRSGPAPATARTAAAVANRPEALRARFDAEALPHLRSLHATACRMMRNTHDAEDLVQETFLRAYRAFEGYTPDTNIRAWLFTILHRVRTDFYRRSARSPQTVELPEQGVPVKAPQDALASGHEDIERALQGLPDVFRTAVLLRDVQDLSYDEIAKATNVPIGTVMSRIHRGRGLLREALRQKAS